MSTTIARRTHRVVSQEEWLAARAELLERRLRVDEHGAEVAERREQDREADRQDEEERARHRR